MLWEAGQERVNRESHDRLTELYVAARDGYISGNVAIGKATARGDVTPAYARPTPAQEQARAHRGLADLIAAFPGQAAKGREFTN